LETVCEIHCLKEGERDGEPDVVPPRVGQWERRWVEAAQRGDAESFERIVLAYQQRIFNLAYRLLGEREEAEDLTQEVFINVFRHLSKFRGQSQFSTWIYQVTMNHCRNRLKYLKRRQHHATESLDNPVHTDEGEIDKDLPNEGDVPEDVLYRQQIQGLVQVALGRLQEDYREVVVLRDIQDLSYQEISDILRLPEGTIKSRLHRARLELRETLRSMGIKRGS
jgi:RNA polymerase sigma-70 factor (ECF subfamily)